MIMVEWELTTFLRQDPWLDASPRTHGVTSLRAPCGATGNPMAPDTKMWSIPTTQCKILQPNGQPCHQILIALCSFNGRISSWIQVKTIVNFKLPDWKSGCPRWLLVVQRNQAFVFIGPGEIIYIYIYIYSVSPNISQLVGSKQWYCDISGSAIYRAFVMSQNQAPFSSALWVRMGPLCV